MRRPGLTQEAVSEAAQQLAAAGEEPSLVNVQTKIGGGSYTTIKKYLAVWKAQQTEQPVMDAPPEVAQQASELARRVWAAAAALAEQQIAQVRSEAEQQIAEARQALVTAEAEITRQEAEAEQHAQQLAGAQQATQDAQRAADAARGAVEVAEAKTALVEQQLAEARTQLEAVRSAAEAVQQQLLDQARQIGEIDALRRQVQEQGALIERLTQSRGDTA